MKRSVAGSGPAMTVSRPQLSTPILIQSRLDSRQPQFVRRRRSTVKSRGSSYCAMRTCGELSHLSRRCWSFSRAPTKREQRWRSGIARRSKGERYQNNQSRGVEAEVGSQGQLPHLLAFCTMGVKKRFNSQTLEHSPTRLTCSLHSSTITPSYRHYPKTSSVRREQQLWLL